MLSQGQPLFIYYSLEGLLISMYNQGISCIRGGYESFQLTKVVERNPSVIPGITKTEEKLVFSDSHDHSVLFFSERRISRSLRGIARECKMDSQFVFSSDPRSLHMAKLSLSAVGHGQPSHSINFKFKSLQASRR